MLLSSHQRQLLGAFLRSHRERLTAERAGLQPRDSRRRTAGLRREEVADLCGISPTWYTWIEQGRDISVSATTLSRLAQALRFTVAERAYLFELARTRDPSRAEALLEDDPAAGLQPLLDGFGGPAYAMNAAWCAIAWNRAAATLFADWFGRDDRCLLDYMFVDGRARQLVPDWSERGRRLVAEFRADLGRRPDDPRTRTIVERLVAASGEFAAFWTEQAVLTREGGARLFDHPTLGPLLYEQTTLYPAAWLDHKVVVLSANGAQPPAS